MVTEYSVWLQHKAWFSKQGSSVAVGVRLKSACAAFMQGFGLGLGQGQDED